MTSDDLVTMFEPHGEIVECDIVKNYAFLHYKDSASAERAAAALNGTKFLDNALRVEVSKSRLHQAPGGRGGGSGGGGSGGGGGRGGGSSGEKTKKLFVGNLPPSAKSADLKKMFDTYGHVTDCDIVRDFAFVHFEHEDEAELATDMLNGAEFAGGFLSVEKSHAKRRVGPSGDGCYNCGKPGHISRDCRGGQPGGRGGGRAGGDGGGPMMRGGFGPPGFRAPMFDSYDDLEDYYAFRAAKYGLPVEQFRDRLPPVPSRYRDYVDPYEVHRHAHTAARSYRDPYDRPPPYYYDTTAARRRPTSSAGPGGDVYGHAHEHDRYRFAMRSRDEMPRRRAPPPY